VKDKRGIVDKPFVGRVDRDCPRCHGSGDDELAQLCQHCFGQGTVCRDHYHPDCAVCHDPGYEY
jgi:DnaJ-class molecular chaperone